MRMRVNPRIFSQRLMDMLRTDSNAFFFIYRQRLRVERDLELLFVGGSEDFGCL